MADSGFIGDEGTNVPGPGLFDHGDNARFVKNVVRWLGREMGRSTKIGATPIASEWPRPPSVTG